MTQWVAGYVLSFKDDGPDEAQVLHTGTLEECQALGDNLTAVSYSGDRPIADCEFRIVEIDDDGELVQ